MTLNIRYGNGVLIVVLWEVTTLTEYILYSRRRRTVIAFQNWNLIREESLKCNQQSRFWIESEKIQGTTKRKSSQGSTAIYYDPTCISLRTKTSTPTRAQEQKAWMTTQLTDSARKKLTGSSNLWLTEPIRRIPFAASTSRKSRTARKSVPWGFLPLRTSWCRKYWEWYWNRSTSQFFQTTLTAFVPTGVATLR